MLPRVFISYRRDDSQGSSGRLYDRLADRFPKDRLFMDVDAMAPGTDFVRELDEAVLRCDVLLAVIGRHWLASAAGDGERRIDKADDFVRIEIGSALRHGVRVIPVLVDGASMPSAADLPDDLKPLARRNAFELSHLRFVADADRLGQALATGFSETGSRADPEEDPTAPPQQAAQAEAPSAAEPSPADTARPAEVLSPLRTVGLSATVLAIYSSGALIAAFAQPGTGIWMQRLDPPLAMLTVIGAIVGPPLAFAVWLPRFQVGHFFGTVSATMAGTLTVTLMHYIFSQVLFTRLPELPNDSFGNILLVGLQEAPVLAISAGVLGLFVGQALKSWFPGGGGPGFMRRILLIWFGVGILYGVAVFFLITIAEAHSVTTAGTGDVLATRAEVRVWADTVLYGMAWALTLGLTFRFAGR